MKGLVRAATIVALASIPVLACAHPVLTVRPRPAAVPVRGASLRTTTPGALSRVRPGGATNRAPARPPLNPLKRRWLA